MSEDVHEVQTVLVVVVVGGFPRCPEGKPCSQRYVRRGPGPVSFKHLVRGPQPDVTSWVFVQDALNEQVLLLRQRLCQVTTQSPAVGLSVCPCFGLVDKRVADVSLVVAVAACARCGA